MDQLKALDQQRDALLLKAARVRRGGDEQTARALLDERADLNRVRWALWADIYRPAR